MNELHRSINLRGWSFQNNTDGAYKHRTLQKSVNMPKQVSDNFQLASPLYVCVCAHHFVLLPI